MSDTQDAWFRRQADVLFAAYSDSDATRNEAIAAVSGKKIRVLSWTMNAAGGEQDITFESATTALSGAFELVNNATASASYSGGLFETVAGQALNITQSNAVLLAGHITYVLV